MQKKDLDIAGQIEYNRTVLSRVGLVGAVALQGSSRFLPNQVCAAALGSCWSPRKLGASRYPGIGAKTCPERTCSPGVCHRSQSPPTRTPPGPGIAHLAPSRFKPLRLATGDPRSLPGIDRPDQGSHT